MSVPGVGFGGFSDTGAKIQTIVRDLQQLASTVADYWAKFNAGEREKDKITDTFSRDKARQDLTAAKQRLEKLEKQVATVAPLMRKNVNELMGQIDDLLKKAGA